MLQRLKDLPTVSLRNSFDWDADLIIALARHCENRNKTFSHFSELEKLFYIFLVPLHHISDIELVK